MKIRFRLIWRWSWVITLPMSIVFLYWLGATVKRYYTFGVRYDSRPFVMSLHDTGNIEFRHLLLQLKNAVLPELHSKSTGNRLNAVNLYVPESNLAELDSYLPYSGFKYVKGALLYGDKVRRVKVRYRGDFYYHWAFYKKSLRIKTRKKALFSRMRKFNLIVPKFTEQLHNYLAYQLASMMGLFAPYSEFVNVTLNGRRYGVHILVEQLEELFLRNRGLMPGDIYSGDATTADIYLGVGEDLFKHRGLWKKMAVNNHYPENSFKPLDYLIELINQPLSEEIQKKISEIIDVEQWGRFHAFETIAQTYHFDDIHNWRLYYDPARAVFVPIVWDPVGWAWHHTNRSKLDIIPSKFHQILLQNGDVLRARHKAIENFYAKGMDRSFLKMVDQTIAELVPALSQDPHIMPPDLSEITTAMHRFRDVIKNQLSIVREAYLENNNAIDYAQPKDRVLAFSFAKRCPIKRIILNYRYPIKQAVKVRIRYWQNDKTMAADISDAVSINGSRMTITKCLLPRFAAVPVKYPYYKVLPAYYELEIEGISKKNELLEMLVDQTGRPFKAARLTSRLTKSSFRNIYNIVKPQPAKQALIWQGNIVVNGITTIRRELIIKPGTTVRFNPESSLLILNRLLAEGTKEQPIHFIPAADKPWGAVILKGPLADGSRLKHCGFFGGSGLKGDLFEYSAMFSVHGVSGVEIKHCTFKDSKITDDMVHAVYSDIRFVDSAFIRSAFDAIDLDISTAEIKRCRFIDSGNDALDLMNTKALLMDSVLKGSKDKGISIGERSKILAINNRFIGNSIAVQSKDDSVVVLYNVNIRKNRQALSAYKKNWRYDNGGKIFVYKGRIADNLKLIDIGKRSKIWLYDSYVDHDIEANSKKIRLDKTVDPKNRKEARVKTLWRFPEEVTELDDLYESYWSRVDPGKRGAL